MDYKEAARNFVENEKQFHLGVIPTEQSNPLTWDLSSAMARDISEGVRVLLSADVNIPKVATEAFKGDIFKRLTADIRHVIDQRRIVLFSSVGASGRMAIQLDATWRLFWTSLIQKLPARRAEFLSIAECCNSLTTGGDRALVRSVENFEDYMSFGRRQVADAHVGPGDVVVGLAECGLSASINGSVLEADDRGCTTYYLYCNPKDILCMHLDRVRVVFERESIIPLPLYVGNMAVSGSTRMQVTTVELLVAGAAMELACGGWLRDNLTEDELSVLGNICLEPEEYARQFESLSAQLSSGEALTGIAEAIALEADTYTRNGLVTYLAHDYLLDILTDTTERQPTFTLPPFRKFADKESPVSWAYAKDPLYPGSIAWQHVFRRPVKGLDWTREDYISMGAAQSIIDNPPQVGSGEVYQYCIGNEDDPSRYSRRPACLTCVDINGSGAFMLPWVGRYAGRFDKAVMLRIGDIGGESLWGHEIRIPLKVPRTIMELLTHLAVKLVFNLLSTGTMARIGRVWSNWMIQVLPTNKKLIDRSTRIISSLAGIPYAQACEEFYKSYLGREPGAEYRESYVVETLRRLGCAPGSDAR